MIPIQLRERATRVVVLMAAFALSWPSIAAAYSSGAGACTVEASTMAPHGGAAPMPPENFTLRPSAPSYTPGEKLAVTVATGGGTYKGILLTAQRSSDGANVGSWVMPPGFQPCLGLAGTLTHASATNRSTLTFTYLAPAAGTGSIVLRAMLVHSFVPNVWRMLAPIKVEEERRATNPR